MSTDSINARIDVRLGSLTGETASARLPVESINAAAPTFYLETFGCQMNDHDSEKVAGVLLGRGYRQVETPDAAGVVLYNTCSIREKAASKVFSRLGLYKDKASQEGKIIGR
jgi:tRNA-2-methylthio-N6-dimethylallyladenosine synthase